MYTDKEHVLDAINAICAKSKWTDSTSILEYINKKFATNADEIYVNIIIQVFYQTKTTLETNLHQRVTSYFIIKANNMTILDETESIHDNPQDDILNIDQSYNTPQITLTDKIQEKDEDKVLNNSIDEIRSWLKTLTISIEDRLTFVENQLSMKNRTDDTTQQSLVIQLLETRITELVKREADKNCIIECLTKTMLNKTNRKETLQRWDGSSNQNIRFTVEALSNENKIKIKIK